MFNDKIVKNYAFYLNEVLSREKNMCQNYTCVEDIDKKVVQ